MYIGAHVSTAGGLDTAIKGGTEIGAETLQIFPSAPLQWKIRGWSDEACAIFKGEWQKNFKQVIFHGIYLANLAAESKENAEKTKNALVETLKLAPKVGVVGTIFHPGSYVDGQMGRKDQIKNIIKEVLAETPKEAKLIFENAAGAKKKGKIGESNEDLAWLLDNSSDKERVGVCLDTCHAFAAGYDIRTKDSYEKYVKDVDVKIDRENVFCWHFNDSKFGLDERMDRHENIGEGHIGKDAFGFILNDPRWTDVSSYLEVPGFEGGGPDKKNINILKKLRK